MRLRCPTCRRVRTRRGSCPCTRACRRMTPGCTAASSPGSQGLVLGDNHQLEYFFSEIDPVCAVELEVREIKPPRGRKAVLIVEIPRRELGAIVLANRPHMDSRQIENPD